MRRHSVPNHFLGIECGGTRTIALLTDPAGRLRQRLEAGPANWRLLGPGRLKALLTRLARQLPPPAAVAIGMAGVRGDDDRTAVRRVAEAIWPGVPVHACHDLETALWAAGGSPDHVPRVIVLSGTGSCCYGRTPGGQTAKIGGWGHILGDKGSGYEIGLRALKAVVFYLDRDGEWTRLGQRILRATQLNDPEQLIAWVQTATKDQVAALTVEVFAAAGERDTIARDILKGAAAVLAKDAVACARRLTPKSGPVEFVFAGSVLQKQPGFATQVRRAIREQCPSAQFTKLRRETAWGAIELARREGQPLVGVKGSGTTGHIPVTDRRPDLVAPGELSTTEQRHPRSLRLDRMPIGEAIDLMLAEDAKIPAAIRRESTRIEKLIRLVVRSFKRGGRLFYIGAGTSGRLGVLDASECPPTFRTPPDLVQGIIAGSQPALWSAVEGAEDDAEAGGQAVVFRGVGRNDVVLGIAASGRTPFVQGALRQARQRGAATALLHFNSRLQIPAKHRPAVVLCPRIGPEVLTGSTRLKAGTATKLILNLITTLAMVQMGKVISNLMVDLNPSNTKLRDRAVRIVATLSGHALEDCRQVLSKAGWNVKQALRRLGFRR